MNKLLTKIVGVVIGTSMAVGVGTAVVAKNSQGINSEVNAAETEALSWSRSGNNDTVTSGFVLSATASAKSGYYQDASSGEGYIMVQKGTAQEKTNIWTTTPTSISFTAKVGGGTGNKDLTNSVRVCLVDTNGDDIDDTEETVTSHITTAGGDTYSNISFSTKPSSASGVKIYHSKESGYNVRYFSFSLSYEAAVSVTYDIDTTGIVHGTATGATTIAKNASATVTIVPDDGYKLPANGDSITVTNATKTSFDSTTGALVISNPSDDVSISVTLPTATRYTISTSLTGLTATGATHIYENGTAEVILSVVDSTTKALPGTITVTNAVNHSYSSTTGVVTISGATDNVTITAAAIDKPAERTEIFDFTDSSLWDGTQKDEHDDSVYARTVNFITMEWGSNNQASKAGANWNPARIYKNHIVKVSSTTGAGAVITIKSITFHTVKNGDNSTTSGTDGATRTILQPTVNPGSIASTVDDQDVIYTITGTVTEFSLVTSAQTRWSTVEVTYEKDQTPVALNSITATCGSVLVSQKVVPVITFNPSTASNKNVTLSIVEGTSDLAEISSDGKAIIGKGNGTARLRITPEDTNASAITIDVTVNALPNICDIEIGKKYALVSEHSSTKYELSGIYDGATPYGQSETYDTVPDNLLQIRAVNGLYARTVALEVTINSETKYLSYDSTANENSLNLSSSITRESSWIFNEETYTKSGNSVTGLVVRNVEVYAKILAFYYSSQNPRFAVYPLNTLTSSADCEAVSFSEIAEAKTDKEYVQDFVDLYLHMTTYTENNGWCKDNEHAYYLTAKAGYNSIIHGNSDREDLWENDSDFADAKARYEKWAVFNNDAAPYDGYDTVHTTLHANFSRSIIADSGSISTVVAILTIISLTTLGGYFLLRKRKEER